MEFEIKSSNKYELINITDQVQKAVAKTKVKEGADEPGLKQDFYDLFKELEGRSYRHPDGNAEAHILAGIIGHSRVVPINDGKLVLGTWQAILLVELDGPRQRRITVIPLSS